MLSFDPYISLYISLKNFYLLGFTLLLAVLGVIGGGNQSSALDSPNNPSTTNTAEADVQIAGQVTDSLGVPMNDVFVTLISDTGQNPLIKHTDVGGNYAFSGVPSGSYKIQFSRNGYAEIWYSGAANRTDATAITVTASNTISGIDGVLGVGGAITGQVTDSSGTPMSGVFVSLIRATDNFGVTTRLTDISGNYTFYGLASGSYKVGFQKNGHASIWYSGAANQTEATAMTVTAPNTTSGIDGVM